jgi:hypothetical protein
MRSVLLVNFQEERVGSFPIPRSSVGARAMLLLKNAGHRKFHVGRLNKPVELSNFFRISNPKLMRLLYASTIVDGEHVRVQPIGFAHYIEVEYLSMRDENCGMRTHTTS